MLVCRHDTILAWLNTTAISTWFDPLTGKSARETVNPREFPRQMMLGRGRSSVNLNTASGEPFFAWHLPCVTASTPGSADTKTVSRKYAENQPAVQV